MYKCEYCGCVCEIKLVDESFDHEFGTEQVRFFASDCCHGDIIDEFNRVLSQSELETIVLYEIEASF